VDFDALGANHFHLETQVRVSGGKAYIKFVEALLSNDLSLPYNINGYDFKIFNDISMMQQEILKHEREVGLSRLVAGYAWEWISKHNKFAYDIEIDGAQFRWNSTNTDWINSEHAIDEVGCIHTVQGYDLNYAGVIIGPELLMKNGRITIDMNAYKDRAAKDLGKSTDDMRAYVLNIYKTLMTRGIKGTYVYVCDPKLKEYIYKSMDCILYR
jgi:DUF2075 family protein